MTDRNDRTGILAERFLMAAQQLGDHLLADLQERAPEFADGVAFAVDQGEALAVSFVIGESNSIELWSVNDYKTIRRISTVPLRSTRGKG